MEEAAFQHQTETPASGVCSGIRPLLPAPTGGASSSCLPLHTISQEEEIALLRALTMMPPKGLKALAMREDAPAWAVGYAVAILKDMQRGSTATLEKIANRVRKASPSSSCRREAGAQLSLPGF